MKCLQVERKGRVCILEHSGELTLDTIPEIKEQTEPYLDSPDFQILVMDLSNTVFLDSSGIGFLVHVNSRMRSKNTKLYLYNLSPQVKKSLSLVRLLEFFNILESEAALETLIQGEPDEQ